MLTGRSQSLHALSFSAACLTSAQVFPKIEQKHLFGIPLEVPTLPASIVLLKRGTKPCTGALTTIRNKLNARTWNRTKAILGFVMNAMSMHSKQTILILVISQIIQRFNGGVIFARQSPHVIPAIQFLGLVLPFCPSVSISKLSKHGSWQSTSNNAIITVPLMNPAIVSADDFCRMALYAGTPQGLAASRINVVRLKSQRLFNLPLQERIPATPRTTRSKARIRTTTKKGLIG